MKAHLEAARAFALLCVLLSGAAPAPGRTTGEPRALIPARDLQADFAVFRRAYEELHPGLYRYNSKAQMEAHFAALKSQLDRDLTLQQAYVAFSTFLARIKCGHSYPNFFNQPKQVAETLFRGRNRVPFYFRWVNRRMIVTRNFSTEARLRPGTEVLAIGGVPVGTILKRLTTVARADGSNNAKRVSYLEVSGASDYEAFDIYFPMFYPQAGGLLELRIKPPLSSRTTDVSVEALTYEQRAAPIREQTEARRGDGPVWEFKFLDERTAYLRMPTWALYNSKWDWKGFLDDVFDQLARKQSADLIIDLRGNEGGLSVGDFILGRLVSRDLRLGQFKRLVRYRKVPEDLKPYLNTWDKSFYDWGNAATESGSGFYTLRRDGEEAAGKLIKASARPFKGRTYVLVDASNSSATFEFAQALRQHRLATLVGQPTGGNQRGINGGAFFFLRLPHSKIEIDIPLIGFYPPSSRPDAGLRPDIPVEPRAEDIARGIDTELNALKEHLRGTGTRRASRATRHPSRTTH